MMWPRYLGLLALCAVTAALFAAGFWPAAVVSGIVGLALFNFVTSRQVRRIEAEFAAAGIEPDYSESDARDFRRIGLAGTGALLLVFVMLLVWVVVSAVR